MKNLTHIKLFEAFESVKLSKTLNYVKDGKEDFLNQLKSICNTIDFPYSKLSDEYFDYLSFKRALDKADIVTDETCTATSAQSFPEYAVDGEVCQDGKVKRKWGRGVRVVKCEVCEGTGVKRQKEGDVKLVKFWFNKDGKFIYTSAVDGIIRGKSNEKTLSTSESDYEDESKWLSSRQFLNQVSNGDYAMLRINDIDTICYIIKNRQGVYAIQNRHTGSTPRDNDWRDIARFSWAITSGGEFNGGKILRRKVEVEVGEVDPFTWNIGLDFGYRGLGINKRVDLKSKLSDAHFALVLDFGKLKESGYMKKANIRLEREEAKSGSKLFWNDENIKKQNLNRYLDIMSKNLDISDNISNITKLVNRIIGFKYALYVNLSSEIKDNFNGIIRRYYKLLKSGEDQKQYNLEDLNEYVSYSFNSSMTRMNAISNNLKFIKDNTNENGLRILNKLDEISDIIYKKISEFDVETIEDLEVIHQKMLAIRNVFTTERYPHVRNKLYYFFSYLTRSTGSNSLRYLNDYSDSANDIIDDLDKIKRIIERL